MKWLTRKTVDVSNLVGYRGGAENASSSENSMNLRNDEEESAKTEGSADLKSFICSVFRIFVDQIEKWKTNSKISQKTDTTPRNEG
jgi:hypothetical protein